MASSGSALRSAAALLSVAALSACGIDVQGSVEVHAGAGGVGATGGSGGSGGGVGGDSSGGTAGTSGQAGAAGSGGGSTSCSAGDQCVPAAPSGWNYAFLAGSPFVNGAPPAAPCWDGSDPVRYYMDPKTTAECTPCSCGALAGGACSMPMVCSQNGSCTSFQDFSRGDTDCHGSSSGAPSSCMFGGATILATGSCAPSGGMLATTDAWNQIADFCSAKTSGSCGAGSVCLPHGTGPFDGYACVYAPGEQTCPGEYSVRSVIYKQMTDNRSCGACSCTPGAPACLGGDYEFFDDGFCGAKSLDVNGTTCTDVTPAVNDFWPGWGYKKKSDPKLTGSCDPSGGAPSGSVAGDPNTGLTVCCRAAG